MHGWSNVLYTTEYLLYYTHRRSQNMNIKICIIIYLIFVYNYSNNLLPECIFFYTNNNGTHYYIYEMMVSMSTILEVAMSSEYSMVQTISVTYVHESGMFLVIKLTVMSRCPYLNVIENCSYCIMS